MSVPCVTAALRRTKWSRRRTFHEERDVTYINKRNEVRRTITQTASHPILCHPAASHSLAPHLVQSHRIQCRLDPSLPTPLHPVNPTPPTCPCHPSRYTTRRSSAPSIPTLPRSKPTSSAAQLCSALQPPRSMLTHTLALDLSRSISRARSGGLGRYPLAKRNPPNGVPLPCPLRFVSRAYARGEARRGRTCCIYAVRGSAGRAWERTHLLLVCTSHLDWSHFQDSGLEVYGT